MAFPTIGLAAIMDMKSFDKGERAYTSGLDSMNAQTVSVSKRITRALGSITKVALGVGVSAGAAIVGLGAVFLKLAADAAPVPAIAQSFVALGGSIEAMRKGSLGLITDVELMKSFNVAASLVSRDFAQKLPDAMLALGKVAASTGQDMGFLLNSLTTGVGRLSPMILDNLAIQVSLTDAYEDFASANGLVATELSKTEQQAALMAQVMAKLNANTADLPDIAGNASTQLGSMSVMFKNLKTDMGVAFLPVLQAVLEPLIALSRWILPSIVFEVKRLAAFLLRTVVPAFTAVIDTTIRFLSVWLEGRGFLAATTELLRRLIPEETIANAMRLASAIETTFARIRVAITSAMAVIRAVVSNVGGRVSAGRSWLVDTLGLAPDMLQQIRTAFSSLVARLRAGFAEVKRVVLSVFQEFSTGGLRSGFKTALAKVLEVAPTILAFRQKLITKLFEVGRTLLTALGDMFPSIKPLIDEFLIPILNIGETVVTTFTQMKTDVRRVLFSMLGLVREPLEEIGRTFMSVMGNILGIIDAVWPSVLATIQRVVPAALTIISGIMPIVRTVGNVLETVLGDAIPFVLDLFAQMAEFIATAMPQIQRVITKALAVIEIVWTKVWPILQKVVGVAWGAIQKMITTVINVVEGVIDIFLSALEGDWETTWENTKKLLATWVTDILDLVKGVVNNIAKALGIENFDIGKIVEGWVQIGKDVVEGLSKGAEDAWKGVKGKINGLISGLSAGVKKLLGIGSPSRVFAEFGLEMMIGLGKGIDEGQAQVIKKLTKAIGRIVNAFSQLLEIQREFGLEGGGLPDIGNFLDQFEAAIVAVLERLDSIIDRIGEKRIKKIRKSAKRLREILDAVMIDLSKIATATLPDLGRWRDQVIDVTRAMLEVLGHLAFEFGTQAIEDAAAWAGAVTTLVGIVGPAVDAITALMSFEDLPGNFDEITDIFVERLDNVLEKLVRLAATYAIEGTEAASKFFAAVQNISGAVSPSVAAIASLLSFEDLPGNFDEIVDIFVERLDNVLEKLIKMASSYNLEGTEAAAKLFSAMQGIVSIVSPGIEAIQTLLLFEDITGNFDEAVDIFIERLDNMLEKLIPLASKYDLEGAGAASKFFTAADSIVRIITPGIEAIKSLLSFENISGNFDEAVDIFIEQLDNVLEKLILLASTFDLEGTEAASKFFSAATSIVSIVAPGIQALAAMTDFAAVENLAEKSAEFGNQIAIMIEQFQEATEAVGVVLGEDATVFATAATAIVGLVEPGIKALAALMGFTRVEGIAQKAADFGADLAIVVRELADVASEFVVIGEDGSPSGLEAAERFAIAAGKIVGFIEPAIAALASLGTLAETKDLTGKLRLFGRQIGQVLATIQAIGESFARGGGRAQFPGEGRAGDAPGTSGLEAAELFASAVATISTGIRGAIDLIDGFMTYKGREIAGGLATFAQNMLQLRQLLIEQADEMEMVVPAAERFEAAMAAISGAFKAGLDLLVGLPTVGTGLLAGLGARIRDALAEVTAAFTSETSSAAAAAYAYGFTVGRGASFGFRDGFASIPTPTFTVGAPAGGTGGSDTPPRGATTVNITISGTTINSGIDAATFNASVTQAVKEAIR